MMAGRAELPRSSGGHRDSGAGFLHSLLTATSACAVAGDGRSAPVTVAGTDVANLTPPGVLGRGLSFAHRGHRLPPAVARKTRAAAACGRLSPHPVMILAAGVDDRISHSAESLFMYCW
ncbi:hypothetical protein Acsp04_17640 [Actinomadura sp. NBRC 104425]|nr:hypothetical protein Acsp04_17640 [Actinomadura sp. NBRC 104425]